MVPTPDPTSSITVVDQIAHMVEEHGLSLILLLLLLVFLVPKLNQVWSHFIEDRDSKRKNTVESVIRFDISVRGLLKEAMADMKSDWAHLWQFHNGTHGIGKPKVPFMYLSLTHEVHRESVNPMRQTFSQLPTAMLDSFNEDLLTKEIIEHHPSVPQNSGEFARGMRNLGAKAGYLVPIRDEMGEIIGIFSIGFATETQLTDEQCRQIQILSRRVGIIMATMGEDSGKNE